MRNTGSVFATGPDKEKILKKSFYTYEDEAGVEQLEIWLELNEGIELPEPDAMDDYAKKLISKLANLNQDFRYQLESLDDGAPLPMVRFFKRKQSPISEAGGHRKQVLVFQKNVNLDADFAFPDDTKCRGTSIKMGLALLITGSQPQPM